jgi:hypothetical protein
VIKGAETFGAPFWDCATSDKDETPGYQRVRAFEVPYKKIVNGQEEQRSLIVINQLGWVDLIARDDSDGKWKVVGALHFNASEMLTNWKTDKPTIGISLEKDKETGEDIINITVVDPNLKKGIGMSFWASYATGGPVSLSIIEE